MGFNSSFYSHITFLCLTYTPLRVLTKYFKLIGTQIEDIPLVHHRIGFHIMPKEGTLRAPTIQYETLMGSLFLLNGGIVEDNPSEHVSESLSVVCGLN